MFTYLFLLYIVIKIRKNKCIKTIQLEKIENCYLIVKYKIKFTHILVNVLKINGSKHYLNILYQLHLKLVISSAIKEHARQTF